MEFIEYTIAWCKGEIFEGRMVLLFGCLLLVCSYLFYKFGTTTYAKEMVLPLLLVGALYTVSGLSMNYSNVQRIKVFAQEYELSPKILIESEKQRVENFMTWYPKVQAIMSAIIVASLFAYVLGGARLQSYALVLILLGLSGLVIDHFSKERAQTYHTKIIEYSKV